MRALNVAGVRADEVQSYMGPPVLRFVAVNAELLPADVERLRDELTDWLERR